MVLGAGRARGMVTGGTMADERIVNDEGYGTIDQPRIRAAIRELLAAIGEDPDREGLLDTPDRVARACEEIFGGSQEDPSAHLLRQFNEPGNENMVIVKDIPFSSMCEHHLLPFTGKAHICYLPKDGRITGLSKLARCVTGYAHRPQVQERLTQQIADAIEARLDPRGVLVVLEASHTCMTMRGIKKPGSKTMTIAVRGAFAEEEKLQNRFWQMLR
jgi:GTP cyclohydrolase I